MFILKAIPPTPSADAIAAIAIPTFAPRLSLPLVLFLFVGAASPTSGGVGGVAGPGGVSGDIVGDGSGVMDALTLVGGGVTGALALVGGGEAAPTVT